MTSSTWSPTMTQQSLSVLCLATSSALTDILELTDMSKAERGARTVLDTKALSQKAKCQISLLGSRMIIPNRRPKNWLVSSIKRHKLNSTSFWICQFLLVKIMFLTLLFLNQPTCCIKFNPESAGSNLCLLNSANVLRQQRFVWYVEVAAVDLRWQDQFHAAMG